MVYHQPALDATFGALADPTRREILARLAAGDRTIGELASRFDMTLPAVSKHLYVLERAGLARVARDGRVRRATLRAQPMRAALAWIARYQRFWESELDQLARYLENPSTPESTWPDEPPRPTPPPPPRTPPARPSRSAASSAHRGNASSTRGRRRKS